MSKTITDHIYLNDPKTTMYVYCRVSVKRGNDEDRTSLDVQEQRGIDFCEGLGLIPFVIKLCKYLIIKH